MVVNKKKALSARAKKYAVRDWTLLGGLSGVGPDLLPRGGGGYCGGGEQVVCGY